MNLQQPYDQRTRPAGRGRGYFQAVSNYPRTQNPYPPNRPMNPFPNVIGEISQQTAFYPDYNSPATAASTHQTMNRERLVKFKTDMCKYYISGQTCPFYSSCAFAHGQGELRRNPVSPYSIDYRPDPTAEGTKDENYCLNNIEYYYHPENYKTEYCKSVSTFKPCNRILCALAHSSTELKEKPLNDTPAYLARYQNWDKLREKLDNEEELANFNPDSTYNFTRETVLHYVAKYGQSDLCKRLLDINANVNAKDWKDQTALHKLAAFGGGDVLGTARLLLEAGANKTALDADGATPTSFAAKANRQDLLKLLTSWPDAEGGTGAVAEPRKLYTEEEFPSDAGSPLFEETTGFIPSEGSFTDLEPPFKRPRIGNNSQVSRPVNDNMFYHIKIKYESKLKMAKIPRKIGLSTLIEFVKQKFNIAEHCTLTYMDPDQDTIIIDDDDDLEIFFDSPDIKKMLQILLKED